MEKLDSNGFTELPSESIETSKEENLGLKKKRKRDEKLQENSIVDSHKIQCPYLGTVKRHLLDFDFEKVCSISLSNMNVYACLCCGKYFQGRGTKTHAYTHSLEQNHHMLINLSDRKIFTLPDNYEVLENSLLDIKVNLKPFYTDEEIKKLDFTTKFSKSLDGVDFLPGCIGLNNIKNTDYVNVVIQTLCRIPMLRDFFLKYDDENYDLKFDLTGLFVQRCSELFKKIWNPKNFKGHVSPHEMMQAVNLASNKVFKIGKQSDAVCFLSWFLNTVHNYFCKKNKSKSSIISECFQGELMIQTFTKTPDSCEDTIEIDGFYYQHEIKKQNYFFLTLDLPKPPLFKKDNEKINIPQVSIYELFKKYNGKTITEDPIKGTKRIYHILKLPQNLILCFKRFEKNQYFTEKNNTIVNFPIKNLSLDEILPESENKYDLLSNVIHDGKPDEGTFRVQAKSKALDQWYEIQDLNISHIMGQSVILSESYIHAYECKK